MKKTYMKPSTQLITLNTKPLLSASDPVVGINRDGHVNAGAVESRRSHSIWDDDEDE